MHPIIFKAGPLILYSFSLFLAVGLFLGSFVVWKFGREDHSEDKLFDSVLISFVSSLAISRLFYIFSHFDFFRFDVLKWILFSHYPGFSFWGGFVGIFIGLAIFIRSKILFKKFIDLFVLSISLILVFGDIGCYLGGCVVGGVAKLPWAVIVPGFESTRHPLPIYMLIADVMVFLMVFKIYYYLKEKRKDLSDSRHGLVALFYLSMFFLLRGTSEFYKDKTFYFREIPVAGILIVVLGFLGLLIYYKKIGRSFKADLRFVLVSFKSLILKIYGKISSIKKKESTIFLLNDSLTIEKKENPNGEPNSEKL